MREIVGAILGNSAPSGTEIVCPGQFAASFHNGWLSGLSWLSWYPPVMAHFLSCPASGRAGETSPNYVPIRLRGTSH